MLKPAEYRQNPGQTHHNPPHNNHPPRDQIQDHTSKTESGPVVADPTQAPRPTARRKPQNTNNPTHRSLAPHPTGPHQIQDRTPKTESGHRTDHPRPRHHGLPPTQPSDLRRATTRKPPGFGGLSHA
ncbi:hypothetical protein BPORC_1870 [Bifidobacterium porcinum]|nr:hypothetical protein BPORC_1870 [Bifidobacterium porcinum]